MMSDRVNRLYVPLLVDAVDEKDDWTGLTDAAARRKRQNRLNQRAYRRRRGIGPKNRGLQVENVDQPTQMTSIQGQIQTLVQQVDHYHPVREPGASNFIVPQPSPSTTVSVSTRIPPIFGNLSSRTDHTTVPIIFPLPVDHLITLVQYNVLRATITNMTMLSLLPTIPMECGNIAAIPIHPLPDTLPPSLLPTPLQRSIPHDPWIDILPLGAMRDNMIINKEKYDHDELCSDLVGGLFEGFNDLELTGVFVWNDPWSASGWEVTEGFVKKWGYLLKGCWEIIEATNYWRAVRGEEKLIVEL